MDINIKKFNTFHENKSEDDKKSGEQEELSDDINDVELEIDGEPAEKGDYEIESIIDVIVPKDKKDKKEYGNSVEESSVTVQSDMTVKEAKRGDIIWITALLRRKGTTSFNSPAKQGVLKLRVIDIYYGLQYINKVLNQ